jgi:SAM-dependent MidA family methyltransferase
LSSVDSLLLIAEVRARGPLTVAAFMDLALYDPRVGYYARAPQRSGRAGDFFTSVDVGPVFGELLAVQVAEMAVLLADVDPAAAFDLVEVGAGNGRLGADLLRALDTHHPEVSARTRLHLVEGSPSARRAQPSTLGPLVERLASSSDRLPDRIEGVVLANELLDAMPVHQVVMRGSELREVYVRADGDRLSSTEGPPSSPALAAYFDDAGIRLEDGWRAEVNLAALAWMHDVACRLRRGFVILIDYGHPARELYSAGHSGGTLTTFMRHTMAGPEVAGRPPWLEHPGEQDITAHVDFTAVQKAGAAGGLVSLGLLDQTYFLMGLLDTAGRAAEWQGAVGRAGRAGLTATTGTTATTATTGTT